MLKIYKFRRIEAIVGYWILEWYGYILVKELATTATIQGDGGSTTGNTRYVSLRLPVLLGHGYSKVKIKMNKLFDYIRLETGSFFESFYRLVWK